MTTTTIVLCDYSNPLHSEALIELINAYIDDKMGGGKPLIEEEELRLINGLSNHPKAIVLLAETGGVFVGLITAFENFSTFTTKPMINIHDVIVRKEYRNQGVGRQLMNAIIQEAENRSCSRLTLEVRTDNHKAQNLYKSLGFRDTEPPMYFWRIERE